MIKNAIAYITRKKNRTFIIFVILTILLSCLYSCLSIMKSSNSLEESLYKISNSSLSITKKDGGYFDIHQFKDIEKIKEVEEKVFQYNGLAKPVKAKVVDGEQKIERDDLPDEFKNVLSLEAANKTEKNTLFNSGVFTIKEGRNIEENDRRKILIHEDFAKKNNLKLNDVISLELIEIGNNGQKKECKFEIIGIFSGKKQEKYTGLSSDFSENMVFVDYETSQEALGRTEGSEVANKILMFSSSPEATDSALNKIKKLNIDWSEYTIEKDTTAFEETLESVRGIKYIIKIMTCSVMLSGIVVLSLILILWLRERIYEIGVLLSIGISKIKIVTQFILELIFISLPSIISSLLLGNLLLSQIVDGFISSDNSAAIINSLFNKNDWILCLENLIQSYFILISIIILSVIVASTMILVKKPKEILSKIS